ncbi:ABC transporter permease [Rhodococcus pyridinivorans]
MTSVTESRRNTSPVSAAPTPNPGRRPGTGNAATATRTRTRRASNTAVWTVLGPLGVFALIIAAWYVVSYLVLDDKRRFLMPPPHEVVTDGLFGHNGREMIDGLMQTAIVSMIGLACAAVIGVAWAVAMHQARWLETALFPYAVVLQCIPILALVPLLGFWFGFGLQSRVLVCTIIALFPMVSNTLFGLKSVDRGYLDLFALRKASRWTTLKKLEFPAALPAIFAGLRISAGLAVVGAVVSDFFFKQGSVGIGMLIDNYRARLQSPQLFAAVLLASVFGVAVFMSFGWLSNRIIGNWSKNKF